MELMKIKSLNPGLVLDLNYRELPFTLLDLTNSNENLNKINISNPKEFENNIQEQIKKDKSSFAVGKYLENRTIYDHCKVFSGERTIHLGIDLWVKDGTEVISPLKGKVHSFSDNDNKGDYGPTLILEHEIGEDVFYSLYGHLSRDSLNLFKEGQIVQKGDLIGSVGSFPENGDWPPHLHFQLITNLMGNKGDFPGVCSEKDIGKFSKICPDPNLILGLKDY